MSATTSYLQSIYWEKIENDVNKEKLKINVVCIKVVALGFICSLCEVHFKYWSYKELTTTLAVNSLHLRNFSCDTSSGEI